MSDVREKRDLVLPPGSYAFMQDVTKGVIKTYTGPTVINPTAQEVPVAYDQKVGTFSRCNNIEDAVRKAPVAVEGYYVMLMNPAKNDSHPNEGSAQSSADLEVGRKVIIPGPSMFALWPGQAADVIRGHHLRSNQYLLVRVYNEDEAKKNWTNAVIKPAAPSDSGSSNNNQPPAPAVATAPPPLDLTVGKLLIIRGTEVSFYIPPTGIVVVADGMDLGRAKYARDALTLERLEYCILVDENGKKRYEYGPKVVFPEPTERFVEASDDKNNASRKFRAIELNELQGIHIKVIADYEGHKAGEELFITGKDQAIYYPREEHSAIKYDGKTKHFSTAVPVGEARYVMNRKTGEINMVKGPAMLLPDPRHEVIVRRALSDKQAQLWYPGNDEAVIYNRGLRTIIEHAPTTRAGALSEGDVERGLTRAMKSSGHKGSGPTLTANFGVAANYLAMESSNVSKEQNFAGAEFSRASTYTQPRTITLDTKYQGVPLIQVWTGYAVMVVSKSGNRRVEVGPKTVQLEYDESLEILELSTGKPKNTTNLLKTVYLRAENNKVSDLVEVETSDHVHMQLNLSYRINFTGDPMKWFSVENYVKFFTDHIRSVLKGAVRKIPVETFYASATDMLRETILKGNKDQTTGMLFPENGMLITDVEVLKVSISDERIRNLLDSTQHDVVKSNIEVSNLRRNLDVVTEKERLNREETSIKADTTKARLIIEGDLASSSLALTLIKLQNRLQEIEHTKKVTLEQEEVANATFESTMKRNRAESDQRLALTKAEQDQRIVMLQAEAEAVVKKYAALQGNFTEALLALSNNETMVKVAEAWNIQRAIGGDSVSDALQRIFQGTSLAPLVGKLVHVGNGNGAGTSKGLTSNLPPA